MTTDIDGALAELGLTVEDLPPAVAATVAAYLTDNEPDMGDLLRHEVAAIPDRHNAMRRRIFGVDNDDQPDPDRNLNGDHRAL